MRYNAPYGSVDQNAAYVNGTPTTKGSVIPAAAIEEPQREIVNAITALGRTPGTALNQLGAAIITASLAYDATVNYDKPRIVIGSNNLIYVWKKANGPASTVMNPIQDTTEEYWMKYSPSPELSSGNNTTAGILKLSDSLEGTELATSGGTAATPYAVGQLYGYLSRLEGIIANFQSQIIDLTDSLVSVRSSLNSRIAALEALMPDDSES